MELRIYHGPVGRCECCGRPTMIHKASTCGSPPDVSWVVSFDLMAALYGPLIPLIREEVVDGKLRLYLIDPSPYDAERRETAYYLDGGGGSLAGPFGPIGLKVCIGNELKENAQHIPEIYVVKTTTRALSIIRNAVIPELPEILEADDTVIPF